jgi:hypothetical protein
VVLSLEFVLAFVGSAVGLLIGILIFDNTALAIVPECCPPPPFQASGSSNDTFTGGGGADQNSRTFLYMFQPSSNAPIGAIVTEIFVHCHGVVSGSDATVDIALYDNFTLISDEVRITCSNPVGDFRNANVQPITVGLPRLGFQNLDNENDGIGDFLFGAGGAGGGSATRWRTGACSPFPSCESIGLPMPNPFPSGDLAFSRQIGTDVKWEIPVAFTQAEADSADALNQARNTALTVIGILPVALFFILFSIFSTIRNEGS